MVLPVETLSIGSREYALEYRRPYNLATAQCRSTQDDTSLLAAYPPNTAETVKTTRRVYACTCTCSEPPRLSRRPVGLSQAGTAWLASRRQ